MCLLLFEAVDCGINHQGHFVEIYARLFKMCGIVADGFDVRSAESR